MADPCYSNIRRAQKSLSHKEMAYPASMSWMGRKKQEKEPTLLEAATGFEPVNNGFADRCLSLLAMPPNLETFMALGSLLKRVRFQHTSLFTRSSSLNLSKIQHFSKGTLFLERETGLEPATITLAT